MADLTIDRAQLEIVIKNDDSRRRIRELEEDSRSLTKEMKQLEKQGKKDTAEWHAKAAALKRNKYELDGLVNQIGLTGLSMKELKKRQGELNAIMNAMDPRTPEYKKLQVQLDAVNGRMRELKTKSQSAGTSLNNMANGFNKYFGIATAFAASITGIALGFRKLANDVAAMDDVYSDVMKTTGKTREEVIGLNEEFKKMDTRTSRESLNMLARDAGKLGINGTRDILDFVDAGNQINVALGEDLGDDAIKNIGKMVGVYKDASTELQNLGLKEQMLAVGSAVNQLGASSTASEPYLVAFAGRLGGIAKQANISMSAILGFGSALDQDMQAVEMSATALQKFIMKIMEDPAKFAKIAGLEVTKFSNLLKTDANSAIIQVLSAMRDKGGFQEMIPIFQDMGLDGARAVGVLSSMAGSIDKVTAAQKIANQAMVEGTSVTAEYNIKNNNLNAQLDKAKKNFQEKALILGESLTPALIKSTNGLSYLIKALVAAPDFYRRNEVAIILLIGAFLALQAAKIKVIAASLVEHLTLKTGIGLKIKDAIILKALLIQEQYRLALIGKTTVAQKAAAIATTTLKTAMAALGGPIGLAILAVTGLIAAIKLYDKYSAESMRLESLNRVRIKETSEANDLLTARYNAQQTAVSGLNKLNAEQILKLKSLTESTIKQAEAELLVAKTRQILTRNENTKTSVWQDVKNVLLSMGVASSVVQRTLADAAKNGAEAATEMDENIQKMGESINNLKQQNTELSNIVNAESNADAITINVKTTATQLEEKARLLGIALKNVAMESEDYTRISNKLAEVNKLLKTSTDETTEGNAKLLASYEKLSAAISVYKTQLTNLVTAGDISAAMGVGALLAQLENSKKYIDEIVAAGGNLEAVIDKVRISISDEGLKPEEAAGDWVKNMMDDFQTALDTEVEPLVLPEMDPLPTPKFDGNFYLDQVKTVSGAAFDIWKNNADARVDYELSALDKAMNRELSNKNLTEEQKDKIREKYAKKERAIKTEAFKKQKVADIIRATIDGTLAVIKAGVLTPLGISTAIANAAMITVIASQKVPQFAKGKYAVTGKDDNRTYHADYVGTPSTGIYTRPSLFAENGAEMIIDAPTTSRMQANAPGLIRAIYRMAGKTTQFADGKYPETMPDINYSIPATDNHLTVTIDRLNLTLDKLLKDGLISKIVYQDLMNFDAKVTDIEQQSMF